VLSPSLHPYLITNKPSVIESHQQTTGGCYARKAEKWGLSRLKQAFLSFSDIFQPNLVIKGVYFIIEQFCKNLMQNLHALLKCQQMSHEEGVPLLFVLTL